MYTIDYSEPERLLTIRLTSFWNVPALVRFLAEATARGIALLVRHGRFAVFVDCSAYQVQSSEIATGFNPLIARATKRGIPIALVPHSALGKLQADRMLAGTGVGVFLDQGEARSWLAARLGETAMRRAA